MLRTLDKYIGSDYTNKLKEDTKPYKSKPFPNPNNSRTTSQERS